MSGFTSLPLAILLAVICIGLIIWSAWPTMKGMRLQKPIRLVASSSKVQKPIRVRLSQEQVAEHHAFIQQSRAVSERLFKNSQGAENRSICSIVRDICQEEPVRQYIMGDGLAGQTVRLLMQHLHDLFDKAGNFQRYTKELSTDSLDNTSISSLCNTIRELVFYYRRLVDETMKMFDNLESRGVRSLWRENSWAPCIHSELADNYDELMRLVVDLKAVTPSYARGLLPKDDQTSKFKRASLLS